MRCGADLFVGNQFLSGNDQPLRRPCHFPVRYHGAVNLAVAVNVCAVHMNHPHVGVKRRKGYIFFPGIGTFHLHGGAVGNGVCAHHAAGWNKRNPHGSGPVAPGEGGIGPFRKLHFAVLHSLAGALGKAPRFETDNIGHIAAVDTLSVYQQLKVMRGRVGGESEVLFALAHNFMYGRRGDAACPKTSAGDIISIMHRRDMARPKW